VYWLHFRPSSLAYVKHGYSFKLTNITDNSLRFTSNYRCKTRGTFHQPPIKKYDHQQSKQYFSVFVRAMLPTTVITWRAQERIQVAGGPCLVVGCDHMRRTTTGYVISVGLSISMYQSHSQERNFLNFHISNFDYISPTHSGFG
jgi:hypothetical protein